MRKWKGLLFCLPVMWVAAYGQSSYIRGQVLDQSNQPLLGVEIYIPSTQQFIHTGSTGTFGFQTPYSSDSVNFTLEGYTPLHIRLAGNRFSTVVMKILPNEAQARRPKLLSLVGKQSYDQRRSLWSGGETYANQVENDPILADRYPGTGFALNIDKASYSNIRRFIHLQMRVPPDAVRIEELLNYFNFDYTPPAPPGLFSIQSQVTDCPWNAVKKLLILHICGKKLNLDKMPPSNFVFLLDASGSMDMPNKLPLIKAAFRSLTNNLRDIDTVSIVMYGGTVAPVLTGVPGTARQKILDAIDGLEANGDTPGAAGILLAYTVAMQHFIRGGNNRVILATDGDFNVGQTGEKELEDLISRQRNTGIYLTCLGVGMGNYKDSKLEALAKRGNGNFSYLDNTQEAEKVLVKELSQNLYTVARDVYASVEFNKDLVKDYRLVGFENRKDAVMDSTSEIDGGEVGSGFSMMAMFEVEGRGDLAAQGPPLAGLRLTYRLPDDSVLRSAVYPCASNYRTLDSLDKAYSFAAAVALYGLILRESKYVPGASFTDVLFLANKGLDPQNFLETDFVQQVEKTIKVYGVKHKRKGED
ncbi:YfbK domain-containing protein [Dinghuibacter silviterrae]|uniref:Ca-activated chloride channel family protein n=1 Tax=Dinghuibacter silviterrae TaxID=1539049 RepID=A0A4R8DMI4_9BACT|nr:von Willebrand factor type A domain-containing protein [Dinghuibacter silviterrae]TDW99173.1 Ca-activated chloride channel family protein [Dinghuibacter silviterrae]